MKNAVSAAVLALLLICALPAAALIADGAPSSSDGDHDPSVAQVDADGQAVRDGPTSVTVDNASMHGVVDAEETTNRLVLEGEVRSRYVSTSPNAGALLAAEDDAIRLDHDQYAVDRAVDNGSNAERQAAIEKTYDRYQNRIDTLEEREREAVSDHANGQLSDDELLTVLVQHHEQANALEDALERLEEDADRTIGVSIDARPDKAFLDQYQGPVRSTITSNGDAEPGDDVLLETSDDGVSLATIAGDEYVRETTRFDNRDPEESAQIESHATAEEYAKSYYPWAVDEQPVGVGLGLSTIVDYSPIQLYWTEVRTQQGTLELSLDTGTAGVYREVQSLSVADLPTTGEPETWTNDTLTMTVNRTAVNGPMEVIVTDEETGEPADATLTVDGHEVGETRDDGTLWILPPTGEFELAANGTDDTVNATVPGWASTLDEDAG